MLDKADYYFKMDAILQDKSKFKRLTSDPLKTTTNRENKIRGFLRSLKNESIISGELYEKLIPTGSIPGILYGLPKIHKANIPLRPILSTIGTHSYNLSKYLVSLLHDISVSPFMISDTFSSTNELRNPNLDTDHIFMTSFDISSLITHVPLDDTIDIIISKLFLNSTHHLGFTRAQFKELLSLAVKNCHFLFNGHLYEQVDGVAMGSPVVHCLLIFFYLLTNASGLTTAHLNLNLFISDGMLLIFLLSSNPKTASNLFLIT